MISITRIIIIITTTPPPAKAVYWGWTPKTAIKASSTGNDRCHHHVCDQMTKWPSFIHQGGLQTISELSNSLLRTKEEFTDSRTTRFHHRQHCHHHHQHQHPQQQHRYQHRHCRQAFKEEDFSLKVASGLVRAPEILKKRFRDFPRIQICPFESRELF